MGTEPRGRPARTGAEILATAVAEAGIGTWSLDVATDTVGCNDVFARLFGLADVSEASFDSLVAHAIPEDRAGVVAEMTRARTEKRPILHRCRIKRVDDGTIRWVEATGSFAFDENGVPVAAAGTLRDVTTEVETATALAVSKKRLEMAVVGAKTATWEWILEDDRVLHESLPVSLGYSVEEMPRTAREWASLALEDDAAHTAIVMRDLAEGRTELVDIDIRVRAKSGEPRWLNMRAGSVRDAAGKVVRVVGTSVDINERKIAEERLREQFESLESILEHLPVMVTFYDAATARFSFVNGAAERILGWSRTEWLETDILGKLLVDPGQREACVAYMLEGPTGTWRKFPERTRDGRIVETSWCNVRLPDGRMMGIGQDVTFETQLQQTQKLESLGVLAGGIAHDFNNLLVGILANASLARAESPPGLDEILADVERSAERLAELTRQLLAYAGKGRFVIQSFDLGAVVREMTALLAAAVSKRAAFTVDIPSSLPPLEGDVTQIRQVVMNLITNASDALGDRDGEILVRARTVTLAEEQTTNVTGQVAPGRYVSLEVSDTGSGMSPDTLAHIFEPFFTTKFAGRGLGLAATLGIVRGHHGALDVTSDVGRGSTFRLLLPAPEEARTERGASARGPVVLVVEDDPLVAQVSRRILERRGFTVHLAADAVAAMRVVASTPGLALVLLDWTTAEGDARATLAALQERAASVRVVVTSGAPGAADVARAPNVAGFLPKPFGNDELVRAVTAALDEKR